MSIQDEAKREIIFTASGRNKSYEGHLVVSSLPTTWELLISNTFCKNFPYSLGERKKKYIHPESRHRATWFKIYLKRYIWIHLKPGDHLGPQFELFVLWVNVVIEHGALRWELDGFELSNPPLAELHSVVDQLHSHRETQRVGNAVNTVK